VSSLSRREMLRHITCVSSALPYVSSVAYAQDRWPSRELHSICGSPPGSGIDLFVRFYSKKLQNAVGKPVIVENRVGALGNIATEYLARSKPDGLTLGIMQGSVSLAAAASLFKKLPFDPINDFEHVALLSKLPFILVVPSDSPFQTLADLTASLEETGGRVSYGSVATLGVVASELYKDQFGLKTAEVKYMDPATALNDLYDKRIAFMHVSAGFAQEPLKSGRLRALATSAADSTEATRAIPSAREAGIFNSNLLSWWSVQVAKGTPKPILDRLEKLFAEIAVAPDTKAFLANAGGDPMPGGRKQAKTRLIEETKAWEGYVKLAHIEQL
jgi:tripartite-type tricarboxylate transporter receptor subunit TctC